MTTAARSDGFMQFSKDIAKQFLHTIVFVDEQAHFKKTELPEQLTTPGRGIKPVESTNSIEISKQQTHDLNAKEVMDTFASEGMICTVLKPDASEKFPLGNAIEAAKRADAIILDWEIHNDKGNKALEIIQRIVEDDLEHCPRLRLILIYSGEPNIIGISEKVGNCLGSGYKKAGEFTFIRGHLRIAIFSKEHTKVRDTYEHRVIPINRLPDLLAEEMAQITAGILSNVALKSISILRDNTHMILGTFGKDLDPAYLSHRALLPNPDDAMEHAVDLVVSEYRSVLETHEAEKIANMDIISEYVRNRVGDDAEKEIKFGSKRAKLKCSDLVDIQEKGLLNSTWLDKYVEENHHTVSNIQRKKEELENSAYPTLTEIFTIDGEDSDASDNKYSSVSSLKRRNGSVVSSPVLTQGTILKEESDTGEHEAPSDGMDNYYLCIQPRCDCVRIDNERSFIFLPLQVMEMDNFDLVIGLEGNEFVRLKIAKTAYELISFKFPINGSEERLIKSKKEGDKYYFQSNGKRFRWIAELKNDQSQRIVNNFAAKLSRVGTDDYEWLRRWAR